MKQIMHFDEMSGRTICGVTVFDFDGNVAILFEDETYIVIGGTEDYGHGVGISASNKLDNFDRNRAAIISDAELAEIELKEKNKKLDRQKFNELAELRRLTDKYGQLGRIEHDMNVIMEDD
jgi:hypothetical protein